MPRRPPSFTAAGAFYGDSVTLASATVTGAGQSGAVSAGEWNTLRLSLAVTARSGTSPSLTVTVQHSEDGATWASLGSFAAATNVGTERKVFTGLDRYVRCSWTTSGTNPSFTFSVSGEGL